MAHEREVGPTAIALARLMAEHDVSNRVLADALGHVSISTVRNVLQGRRSPRVETLASVVDAMNRIFKERGMRKRVRVADLVAMTKRSVQGDEHEPRAECDFSTGSRGKYAKRSAEGSNVVVLAPDVARAFPDAASVNRALRTLLKIAKREAER